MVPGSLFFLLKNLVSLVVISLDMSDNLCLLEKTLLILPGSIFKFSDIGIALYMPKAFTDVFINLFIDLPAITISAPFGTCVSINSIIDDNAFALNIIYD